MGVKKHNTIYNQQLWTCLTPVDNQDIILIRRGVDDFSVRSLPVQVIIEPTPPRFKGLGIKWQGYQFTIFTVTKNMNSKLIASVIFWIFFTLVIIPVSFHYAFSGEITLFLYVYCTVKQGYIEVSRKSNFNLLQNDLLCLISL